MLLESLFQARKSSGHIYVCMVYRFSLCDCSIGFWNCSNSVIFLLDFGTVPTVWYLLNCSNRVIFFELSRQCDIFLTLPTVWYLLSFILSLSWNVKCIIALCTVVVTYQSIYINQNVVIVNTNRNTKDLLFKSLFSVYCFVNHFRLLVPFFHLVVVLSISLKEQFEDTKGVVKTRKWKKGHYNDKQWSMKHYTES